MDSNIDAVAASNAYNIMANVRKPLQRRKAKAKEGAAPKKRGTENPRDREKRRKKWISWRRAKVKKEICNNNTCNPGTTASTTNHQKETVCTAQLKRGKKHAKTYYFETSIWYIKVDACSSNVTSFRILHFVLHSLPLWLWCVWWAAIAQFSFLFLSRYFAPNIRNNYIAGLRLRMRDK